MLAMIDFLIWCRIVQTRQKRVYTYMRLNPWNPFSYVVLVFIVLFVLFAFIGSLCIFGYKHTKTVAKDVIQNPFTWDN